MNILKNVFAALFITLAIAGCSSSDDVKFGAAPNIPEKSPGELFYSYELNSMLKEFEKEVVFIRSMSDFPTAVSGNITLEDGKFYYLDLPVGTSLTTSDKFTLPSGGSARFGGREASLSIINYTGTGALFNGTDISVLNLAEIGFTMASGSSLLDISATNFDTAFFMQDVTIFDGGSIGAINAVGTVSFQNVGWFGLDDGVHLTGGADTVLFHVMQAKDGAGAGGTLISLDSGSFSSVDISTAFFEPEATESVFDFDAGATFGRITVVGCNSSDIDLTFATGSQDQSGASHYFTGNEGIPNSTKAANYGMNDNATATDIITSGSWVKVAGTTAQGAVLEKFSLPVSNRATFLNTQFQGKITASVSATTGNSSAKVYEFSIFKNGVIVPNSITKRTITNQVGAIPVQAATSLTTNDYIEVYVRQIDGNVDVTVTDLNVYIGQ